MISDVLFEAIEEINTYLSDDTYTGDLRQRIIGLLDQMEALRIELDTPPER